MDDEFLDVICRGCGCLTDPDDMVDDCCFVCAPDPTEDYDHGQ